MAENNHDRDVVFTSALRLKDVQYALQLAQKLGVGSTFGELAANLLRKLCERGAGQANESKIIEVVRIPSTSPSRRNPSPQPSPLRRGERE